MKLAAFFLLAVVSVVPHGHAADTTTASGLPSDVAEFRKRRDLCDHFRGEDPYNKERRKFLEENLKKYCVGIDRDLASLKKKYNNSDAVLKALSAYEVKIEGATDF
jgi:hypothetical protein